MAWTEIKDDEHPENNSECCEVGVEHLTKIECLLEKILAHLEHCKDSKSEDESEEEEIVIGYHERKY